MVTCDIRSGVSLAPRSTLGVGGDARWFVAASTPAQVVAAHQWASDRAVTLFILGGGSNLVIADAGVNALVLQMGLRGVSFTQEGTEVRVRAAAGEPWDTVVAAAVERDLGGFECLSGIPGSVGGTPVQNVGAYGQEVAETIVDVTALDRTTGAVVTLDNASCLFEYRTSLFKREPARYIVSEVTFRLRPGDAPSLRYPDLVRHIEAGLAAPTLAGVRQAVLAVRRSKGMVVDGADSDTRSVGSFFVNPVVSASEYEAIASRVSGGAPPAFPLMDGRTKIPAAWLIEQAGFGKGYVVGRVGLSTKHPLALVNRGGAAASDVVTLAVRIKREVAERFGVSLRPEPVFVGFESDPDVDYLQRG